MTIVVYDTETSGLSRHHDVVLQAAFIVCSDDLVVQREIVLRGRPPQHIIPTPDALLITQTTPAMLDGAPLSHLGLMQAIASVVSTAGPARWIGHNSLKFDETILRQNFFQTLHPVYATQSPGSSRADVMIMAQAIAAQEPWALTVPLNDAGKPTFRLGPHDLGRSRSIHCEPHARLDGGGKRLVLGPTQLIALAARPVAQGAARPSQPPFSASTPLVGGVR